MSGPPQPGARDLDGFLADWSDLHGHLDPRSSRLTLGWLRTVHRLAGPLVRRRVSPMLLTAVGVALAALAVAPAAAGGRWPVLAAAALFASCLCDGLDGAVAVGSGRASRFGYVVDSLADRVADVLALVAVALTGGSGAWCVLAGVAGGLLEYLRARAGAAGYTGIGVVSLGERPTRLVVLMAGLLVAGAAPAHARLAADLAAGAVALLAAAGTGQLLLVLRRALRA